MVVMLPITVMEGTFMGLQFIDVDVTMDSGRACKGGYTGLKHLSTGNPVP